jgi:hypothetical protein
VAPDALASLLSLSPSRHPDRDGVAALVWLAADSDRDGTCLPRRRLKRLETRGTSAARGRHDVLHHKAEQLVLDPFGGIQLQKRH